MLLQFPHPMNERSGLAGKLLLLMFLLPIALIILLLVWIF